MSVAQLLPKVRLADEHLESNINKCTVQDSSGTEDKASELIGA